jgi:predicted deacetylase
MSGKGRAAEKLAGATAQLDLRRHAPGGASTLPPISVSSPPPGAPARSARGGGSRGGDGRRRIAVALHDIEPATFERCALIRDWLDDHGIDRVTLLVIPARDLHPLGERSPEMIEWLAERRRAGDSIAQHGFQHEQLRRGGWNQRAAEFVGLDGTETRRAVEAGWRVLKLAGIEPDGFVAPAYAYTRALRETLAADGMLNSRFRWWAGLLRLHGASSGTGTSARQLLAPAWGLGSKSVARRALSPTFIRAGAWLCGETLRLDLHPEDLEHSRQMLAFEQVLGRASTRRRAITYDELVAGV